MGAIVDYLRQSNPIAAVRFVEAAQAKFEHIAFMPRAYPKLLTTNPALAQLRKRPLTGAYRRYIAFYRIVGDEWVDVVRVLHAARDLDRILGEPSS